MADVCIAEASLTGLHQEATTQPIALLRLTALRSMSEAGGAGRVPESESRG